MTNAPRLRANVGLGVVALAVTALLAEGGTRLAFRWRHGYSYDESLRYVPHPELVFQHNPLYFAWRGRPADRFAFFYIPPVEDRDARPRLWVLGESTSDALPDASDWPARLQARLPGVRIVNMGHGGYGTRQLAWLYHHYRSSVRPDAVLIDEGWNYRGVVASPRGWRPANTSSPHDSPAQRLSARLVNNSAAYGLLWQASYATAAATCVSPSAFDDEVPPWEADLLNLVKEVRSEQPTYLVLFPGLAMRDDVQPLVGERFGCVAADWQSYRRGYEDRMAAIGRVGAKAGVPVLDVRPAYARLPPATHVSSFTDAAHLAAAGNRLLAQALFEELSRKGAPAEWKAGREAGS